MDPMTKAFVADIHGFVAARGLELVSFAKGQRKDDLAQEFLAKFTDDSDATGSAVLCTSTSGRMT
jgi:hypothetical protein